MIYSKIRQRAYCHVMRFLLAVVIDTQVVDCSVSSPLNLPRGIEVFYLRWNRCLNHLIEFRVVG